MLALLVRKVFRVVKAQPVLPDRKDFKAYKVLLVARAFKAQPVSLDHRDFKGHKAFKVQPVSLALRA